jgi:succinate dehydrogenase/fumarate reductase flavoprotein subunit
MESEKLNFDDFLVTVYRLNTLVIGSGAAALNAAVSLDSLGVKDIVVATERWKGGTSNNAGSDKQTYYKLSLSGKQPDSVVDMARDLFSGKCMHGDIALCEAQGSVRSFMRLVELGVEFPYDIYGSYPGYKTDHDPRSRATSAGPYTSHRMFEALAGEVKRRKIKILNHHHCIALLTGSSKTRVSGALAINTSEKDFRKAFVLFNSQNVVLGTGGPAGIYESSVYPHSQSGSTGMAFLAGASGQNLTESQFGIASTKFRWNLSGSYQQAIPRYISRDRNGGSEREFLNDHFPDIKSLAKAIFLKGYQWPFDPRKINDFGSSCIDVLVHREINSLNRDVFLDFTKNPSDRNGVSFSAEDADPVVKEYLSNCGALKNSPIRRLKEINSPAIDLYLSHGIDLSSELLQIAVCAQHNNGGLKGNIWWESDLKHLFPVGEVNGSHGVYRPGGSALNSGQVGSSRAALYISRKYQGLPDLNDEFLQEVESQVKSRLEYAGRWIKNGTKHDLKKYFSVIRKRMSAAGGILRNPEKIREAAGQASDMMKYLPELAGASSARELSQCYRLMDHCLTHLIYLKAIDHYIENGGRSRGSYLIENGTDNLMNPDICDFGRDVEKDIIEARYSDGEIHFRMESVRDIPEQDLWFEKVWKEYPEVF